MNTVKGILIDYGGTIDTNGVHWSEIIYRGYQHAALPVAKADFRKAYVYAEQQLEKNAGTIKKEDTFLDIMLKKVRYEIDYLITKNHAAAHNAEKNMASVAGYCYAFARATTEAAKPTLALLARKAPVALVSNFYGNLSAVLHDFGIASFFTAVIESAAVGVRKPQPAIFETGLNALHVQASEAVVIGDSYANDIYPAHGLGCTTVWLKNTGWNDDADSDEKIQANYIIRNLAESLNCL